MKKTDKPKRGRPVTTGTPAMRSLRIDDATWERIQQAAGIAGVPVSEFIRAAANRAAKKSLTSPKRNSRLG